MGYEKVDDENLFRCMIMGYRRRLMRKTLQKRIAKERIRHLLEQARTVFSEDPELSRRYIQRVETLRKRFNIRRTPEMKRAYCKRCYTLWIPGRTLTVRYDKRNRFVLYICDRCGKVYKFAYK